MCVWAVCTGNKRMFQCTADLTRLCSEMARPVVMELENDVLLIYLSRDLIRQNQKKKIRSSDRTATCPGFDLTIEKQTYL